MRVDAEERCPTKYTHRSSRVQQLGDENKLAKVGSRQEQHGEEEETPVCRMWWGGARPWERGLGARPPDGCLLVAAVPRAGEAAPS